ncbi:MAG: DUF433 domain-containing protein [Armatimonadetes bacterium]|nr:DUF433 domain-containing protein [Armatimonadota bacterium]
MEYQQHITIDPEVRAGKPCVKGTRITVYDVFDYLAGGMSVEDLLKEFSQLSDESVRACFAFAADRERKISRSAI